MLAVYKKFQAIMEMEAKLQADKSKIRNDAIEQANDLIAAFGLKASELKFEDKAAPVPAPAVAPKKGRKAKAAKPRKAIAPKYKLDTGETWTGRGKMPRAFASLVREGHKIEEYLIEKPAAEATPPVTPAE